MSVKKLFHSVRSKVDIANVISKIRTLTDLEYPQTYSAHCRAAAQVEAWMRETGFSDVRKYDIEVDGKTVYQDKIMPFAWEITHAKLTVESSPVPFADPVVADYARCPFHVIHGTPELKEGGELFKVLTLDQLLCGTDPYRALVLLPHNKSIIGDGAMLKAVHELGAAGVIYRHLAGKDTPDELCWVNGDTASGHWNLTAYDTPYIGFVVTPRVGMALEAAARAQVGKLVVRAESDGCNFAALEPALTCTIPGKSDREIWLMAHLYEPLASDNSSGVVTALEVATTILKSKKQPEYTLRLCFARELHGFAGLCEKIDTSKAIGALNLDDWSTQAGSDGSTIHPAMPTSPFGGNMLMRKLAADLTGETVLPVYCDYFGIFGDDCAISDSTVGVPTILIGGRNNPYHHNSVLTVENIQQDQLQDSLAFNTIWAQMALYPSKLADKEEEYTGFALKELDRFSAEEIENQHVSAADRREYFAGVLADELEELGFAGGAEKLRSAGSVCADSNYTRLPSGSWFEYAKKIRIERVLRGMPYDMANLADKTVMMTIYTDIGWVLAFADNERTLADLIELTEIQRGKAISEKEIKKLVSQLGRLERGGYIKLHGDIRFNADEFKNELKNCGISEGDTLVVHSGLNSAGLIPGGAAAVNDALLDILGEKGTLFMPAFNNPYIYFEGTIWPTVTHRPFSAESRVTTGALPTELLKRKNCIRDAHTTHSMAGVGAKAAELLSKQGPFDPPTGANSVWAELVKERAKIVFLGDCIPSTTYLHYLETELNLWYLGAAVSRYIDASGNCRSVLIESHLGGCRDFYKGLPSKFYQKALAAGLELRTGKFGVGTFTVIDAEEFYNIARDLLIKEPDLLLCDDERCMFCRSARERRAHSSK